MRARGVEEHNLLVFVGYYFFITLYIKRFHALVNAAGGIATAGIYNLNFDQGGLRHLTAGVSYAIHQAYDTWEQAFAQICHFYPHIKTKDDINNTNTNCCHNTSNLNNPSPAISHCVGPYPNSSTHHKECYYYVELNITHECHQTQNIPRSIHDRLLHIQRQRNQYHQP